MFDGEENSDSDILDKFLGQLHALGLENSGYQSKNSQNKRMIGVLFTTSNVVVNKTRMDDGDEYCSGYGNR
ncbi:hypothetical protein N7475_006346 [Penicillium sp. IBT 31633x]|nr:hypothetical protein N7475_006346 [Penicillium sp. IBT 31633x]